MPLHDRGTAKLDAYLTRILAALAKKAGGELRISAAEIAVLDERVTLVRDFDEQTQEVVLRWGSPACEVYRVAGDAAWQTTPRTVAPVAEPATPATPQTEPLRSGVPDNEKLYKLETALLRRRVARLYREDQQARAREEAEALKGVPRASSG
jgi:hypothetical protein